MATINLNADLNINFNRIEHRYGSDSILVCVGKVGILEYRYDGLRSKDDTLVYKVRGLQPSLKEELGKFATEEECEKFSLKVIEVFIKQLTA